ncbi:MAG: NUDIX hydrolase [Planctomycetales bacterium]|nr:NUDIX hydrolase [Planctomycetales bacterium]
MQRSDPRTVYEGKHLAMRKQGRWEYVTRKIAKPAVGVVAITDMGNVVLVEQYRPPVSRRVIELPAGLSGDVAGAEQESLLAAAQRELLEETGYVASRWTELLTGFSSPGLTDESSTLFLAEGLSRVGSGGGDPTEDITVHEVPFGDVLAWIRRREAVVGHKLLAGLFAACEKLEHEACRK